MVPSFGDSGVVRAVAKLPPFDVWCDSGCQSEFVSWCGCGCACARTPLIADDTGQPSGYRDCATWQLRYLRLLVLRFGVTTRPWLRACTPPGEVPVQGIAMEPRESCSTFQLRVDPSILKPPQVSSEVRI